jgi:hypothetical protein
MELQMEATMSMDDATLMELQEEGTTMEPNPLMAAPKHLTETHGEPIKKNEYSMLDL